MNAFISFILAALPIIWLLVGLGLLKMPAYRASLIALVMTAVIALLYFQTSALHVLQASVEGAMLALFPILWVIVSALFIYNMTLYTGSMDKIKAMLSNLSPDRRIQGLILAFAFGGFLEAVAGFGTAVAIPAGILAAMGFSPILAAAVCLIANTVPVAFGVLGVPIVTLSQVTSLSLDKLTLYTALQLIPLAVILPLILMFVITGSVRKIKGVVGISILAGVVFSLAQSLTAVFVGPELAAVMGSLASLLVIVFVVKKFPVKTPWRFENDQQLETGANVQISFGEAVKAWSPYLIVLVLIFSIKFIPWLNFLNQFPFVVKQQFYFGEGGSPMSFALATSAGTILFVAAIIGGLIQGASFPALAKIFGKTVKQIVTTIVTVISIVAVAKVMGYSGMVQSIAQTIASASGVFYPLIAPFLGAVGTFITGSDTSSNVLFGGLQKQTAVTLGMSPEWLASANAAGATVGKMISPQSIAIAASSTDLSNQEGKLLKITMKYCLLFILVMGVVVYIFNGIVSAA